jgi:hypothetical protein
LKETIIQRDVAAVAAMVGGAEVAHEETTVPFVHDFTRRGVGKQTSRVARSAVDGLSDEGR